MKIYIELFLAFAKVGTMTFGGGYAMLPILSAELVGRKKWITEEELMNYFAIGQCTPGVIAVNTATFTGLKKGGILGGIFATLGVIFPSIAIILALSSLIAVFSEHRAVQGVLAGIRLAVCGLISVTVIKLIRKSVKDFASAVIFLLILALSLILNISPVAVIIPAGLIGIFLNLFRKSSKGGEK